MERIIIRHLSGSRVNQVEEFPVKHLKELSIGRDPSATIKFDPDKDDMVSRLHAKITQDEQDETKFILTDLGSRNRTYVNKTPIEGSASLTAGDVIQLGPKGPEFEFDLDPRPAGAPKNTRFEFGTSSTVPPTREAEYASFTAGASSSEQPKSVGPRTLEFIVGKVKSDTRKSLINVSAALLGILILIGGILWYLNSQKIGEVKDVTLQTQEEAKGIKEEFKKHSAIKSPEDIYKQYSSATVFIVASWKLINLKDGNQVCHFYAHELGTINVKKGKKTISKTFIKEESKIPIYLKLANGSIEPLLMTKISSICKDKHKIGSILTGTGFVVNENGFILTNRHVATPWLVSYERTSQAGSSRPESQTQAALTPAASQQENQRMLPPGKVCNAASKFIGELRKLESYLIRQDELNTIVAEVIKDCRDTTPEDLAKIDKWVPAQTQQFGDDPQFDGLHENLAVKFPDTNTTLKARIVNISEEADVALMRVDTVEPLVTVKLYDPKEDNPGTHKDDPEPGAPITVLGYPEVSLNSYITLYSQDVNNPQAIFKQIHNPTITNGIVAKVITQGAAINSRAIRLTNFDVYQLTINTTGSGNSGGPVFNTDGKVIGIYSLRWQAGGASVSGAIPIKYGRKLMKINEG